MRFWKIKLFFKDVAYYVEGCIYLPFAIIGLCFKFMYIFVTETYKEFTKNSE